MNKIEIISAKNPRCRESEPGVITLDVRFSHLPSEVPFAARQDDEEAHGQELYLRASSGEFGSIAVAPIEPPSEEQQRAEIDSLLKQVAAEMAPLEDAEKIGIITDSEAAKLLAWRRYRVALYRLPESEGWPADVEWPHVQWPEPPSSTQPITLTSAAVRLQHIIN